MQAVFPCVYFKPQQRCQPRPPAAPSCRPALLQERLLQTRVPDLLRRFVLGGEIPEEVRRKASLTPR